MDLAEAYRAFLEFAGGLTVVAFGRDDLVFVDNLRLYGLSDAPPLPPYVNAKAWMTEQGLDMRGLHACDVALLPACRSADTSIMASTMRFRWPPASPP